MKTVIAKINSKGRYEVRTKEVRMERSTKEALVNDLRAKGYKVQFADGSAPTKTEKPATKPVKKVVAEEETPASEPVNQPEIDWDEVLDEVLDEEEVIEKALRDAKYDDDITIYWDGEDRNDIELTAEYPDTHEVEYGKEVTEFIHTLPANITYNDAVKAMKKFLAKKAVEIVLDYMKYEAERKAEADLTEETPVDNTPTEEKSDETDEPAPKSASKPAYIGYRVTLMTEKKPVPKKSNKKALITAGILAGVGLGIGFLVKKIRNKK